MICPGQFPKRYVRVGGTSPTYDIGHRYRRASDDVDTSVRTFACRHSDLNTRQTTSLRYAPLQGCNGLGGCDIRRIKNHVLHQGHETRFRVAVMLIVSHDQKISLETGGRFQDGRIVGISDNDGADGQTKSTTQQILASREVYFSWIARDARSFPAPSITIVVDGLLQRGCLITGAIIDRIVVHRVAKHGIRTRRAGVWRVPGALATMVLGFEPIHKV